jgi:protein-tyrosine phosphatase
LFVCTGNVCRSPFAERWGRRLLLTALGSAAGSVQLESAGIQAVVGSAMHPYIARVLKAWGGDPMDFRARQLDERMPADADLVLTMDGRQRQAVLERAPKALAKTFTLREAAGLLQHVGGEWPGGDHLAARSVGLVRLLADGRSRRGSRSADDVPDPIGHPVEVHQEVAELIAESLLPVLSRIAALHGDSGHGVFPGAGS